MRPLYEMKNTFQKEDENFRKTSQADRNGFNFLSWFLNYLLKNKIETKFETNQE